MTERKKQLDFIQRAFDKARKTTPSGKLFSAGNALIEDILSLALKNETISRFYEKKDKEHPAKPESLFYVVGVDEEWRYEHAKKGGPRDNKEKARVDYYMHAKMGADGILTIGFTTSQHAHVAKKLGWDKGSRSFEATSEKDVWSADGRKFTQDIVRFFIEHAEILTNQGVRRRQTMRIDGSKPLEP